MAPNTEPTDEELAQVTRAARDEVLRRKHESDEWLRQAIEEAIRANRSASHDPGSPNDDRGG